MSRRLVGRGIVAASSTLALVAYGLGAPPAGASTPYPNGTLFIADQSCSCVWEQISYNSEPSYVGGSDEADEDVALDSSGDLFWTQAENGNIEELSPTEGLKTIANAGQPYGVAVDQNGNVYYGADGGLYGLPSGGSPKVISTGYEFTSLAIDGNGDIYGISSHELVIIPAGTSAGGAVDVPGYDDLTSLRLDDNNDVYASTGDGDNAVEFEVGSMDPVNFGSISGFTQGVAVDDEGDVFVGEPSADPGDGIVYEINTSGTPTARSPVPAGWPCTRHRCRRLVPPRRQA
jgi:streptogramin lyase